MANDQLGKLIEGEASRDAIHIAIAPCVAGENLKPSDRVGIQDNLAYASFDNAEQFIGIVDPFLTKTVKKGQKFYICLFPNTITSLKHVWTHPAFETEEMHNFELPISTVSTSNWRTQTVLDLCQTIKESRTEWGSYEAIDRSPILADALEEAGFADRKILDKCRANWIGADDIFHILCLVESEENEKIVHWIEEFAEKMNMTFRKLVDAADTMIRRDYYTHNGEDESYGNGSTEEWRQFWKYYEILSGNKVKEDMNESAPFTCSC